MGTGADRSELSQVVDEQARELDRQRGEIDRQRAELDRQRGELDRQRGEIDRQRAEIDLLKGAMATLQDVAGRINAERDRSLSLSRPALNLTPQYAPRPLQVPRHYLRARAPDPPLRISIVTPSLNQGAFIERTIRSVLDQGYPNLEYMVQDGGSDDGTGEVLERYRQRLARVVSEPDGGQADAINRGFAGSTGEVMAYLNSDDLLLPGSLAYIATFFAAHPEVDAVCGHRILIDAADRDTGLWVLPPYRDWVVTIQDFVPQETLFWRRRSWEAAGGRFDAELYYAIDWDLLLRFVRAGVRVKQLPRFLGAFRVHPEQKTLAAAKIAYGEAEALRARWHGYGMAADEMELRLARFFRRQKLLHLSHLAYRRLPIPRVEVLSPSRVTD